MPSQLAFSTGAGWAGRLGPFALSLNLSLMIDFSELLPKAEFDFVTGTCLTAGFVSKSVLAVTVGVF